MAMWPFNQRKAAPERSPSEAPVQPSIVYTAGPVVAAILQWNDGIAMEMALRHPIASRALEKIASSVAQARWFVEADPNAPMSEQLNKQTRMKDLQALLDSPNGEMTPAMLRYWLALNYAGYGRVPLKIGFSMIDPTLPTGIYPLEVASTYAKRNIHGVIEAYEYGTGDHASKIVSRAKWKPGLENGRPGGFADQIWKPSLKGFQHADDRSSPLHSLGLPLQVTKALLIRAIRSAEGHPNCRYLVTCSKSLTEPQQKALAKYINQDHGPDGIESGKIPMLFNATEVVIHKLDNDLSDIHSKVPLDDMTRMIFGGFGIPIALAGIGAADAAKFAGNFDGSRAAFWQDTIIPSYVSPIFQGLTRMLCPPGLRISADLDSIPALMPARIAAMKELDGVKFLTETEKRDMMGFGPVPQPDPKVPLPPPANPPVAAIEAPKPPVNPPEA